MELNAVTKSVVDRIRAVVGTSNVRTGKEVDTVAAAGEAVLYGRLRSLGGSFSAEHGVGSKRIHALLSTADPTTLKAMRRIKQALDDRVIMSPGKVLPPKA